LRATAVAIAGTINTRTAMTAKKARMAIKV
jgi:hypothetical protein